MIESPFKVGQLWWWFGAPAPKRIHSVTYCPTLPAKSHEWRAYDEEGEFIFSSVELKQGLLVLVQDVEEVSETEDQEENPFAKQVWSVLDRIGNLLIEKNEAYGNSALNPIRIFSKADTLEQLRVRIDDKLNRLAKGHEYPSEDTVDDLLGYLVLYKIGGRNV